MKTAYIVKAYRTAVGKAPKGVFRFKRTDELAAETIQYMMNEIPQLDSSRIDDVIVGNAMPEGSQGLNMARLISLMGLKTVDVPADSTVVIEKPINLGAGDKLETQASANGDIDVDFYHDDQITEYRYSSDSSRLGNFPKELTETLASTLANDICIEIFFWR